MISGPFFAHCGVVGKCCDGVRHRLEGVHAASASLREELLPIAADRALCELHLAILSVGDGEVEAFTFHAPTELTVVCQLALCYGDLHNGVTARRRGAPTDLFDEFVNVASFADACKRRARQADMTPTL